MDPSSRVEGSQTVDQNQTVTAEPAFPKSALSKRLNRKVALQDAQPTEGLAPNPTRKPRKNYFRSILAKVRPLKEPPLSPALAAAAATEEGRLLSAEQFYLVAGAKSHQGKHLKALGAELDKYNLEVCSEFSTLSPFEKTKRTLELKVKTTAFLERKEREATKLFKSSHQAQQRIAATKALREQLDTFLNQQVTQQVAADRRTYSKELCDCLCHDIEQDGGKLMNELYRQPEQLEELASQMELRDFHRFARAHGKRMEVSDPDQVKAVTRICWNIVKDLDSPQIKEQVELFHKDTKAIFNEVNLSGTPGYDRKAEFVGLMRFMLDANVGTDEVSTATYKCYQDGFLSMNMLDEMLDAKITEQGFGLDTQQKVRESVARLNPAAVADLYASDLIPGLDVEVDDRAQVLSLGKLHAFDALLKADESGDKNSEFSNFVKTWDQIRYLAIPEYNQFRGKDGLVDVNLSLSKELVHVTPSWLSSLDAASGNPQEVEALLKKTGWRKAPDTFQFKERLKKAQKDDNKALAAKLELLAARDCLYRYFERRALVEIPVLKPKPS